MLSMSSWLSCSAYFHGFHVFMFSLIQTNNGDNGKHEVQTNPSDHDNHENQKFINKFKTDIEITKIHTVRKNKKS